MSAGAADGGAAAPTPGGLTRASLCPLPLVHVPRAPSTSRGARAAQRWDRAVSRRANEVVRGLNWLAGHRAADAHERASVVQSLARIHEETQERIWQAVARRDPQELPGTLEGTGVDQVLNYVLHV